MSAFSPSAWLAISAIAAIGYVYHGFRAVRVTWKVDSVTSFLTALVFILAVLNAALDASEAWRAL